MATSSLREVLEDLASNPETRAAYGGDVESFLASSGFAGLDPTLIAEAIGAVAANLPVTIATHLSAFTVAASPVPSADAASIDGLDGLRALVDIPILNQPEMFDGIDAEPFLDLGGGDGVNGDFDAGVDILGDAITDDSDGHTPDDTVTQDGLAALDDPFELDSSYASEASEAAPDYEEQVVEDTDIDFLDG
jgi:hypothetical protein